MHNSHLVGFNCTFFFQVVLIAICLSCGESNSGESYSALVSCSCVEMKLTGFNPNPMRTYLYIELCRDHVVALCSKL